MKLIKNIPNAITLLNLSCGVYAIVMLFGQKVQIACLLIWVAAILDFLDGFTAKLLHAHSEIGKQLDALADMVTFGVAPGLLLYQLIAFSCHYQADALVISETRYLPAFFVIIAAAVRLGRFNISPVIPGQFSGLATPAMGCFVASLPLIAFMNNTSINAFLLNTYVLYGLVLLLSFLMVSELPLLNFKPEKWVVKGNEMRIVLIVIALPAIILFKYAAGPIIFAAYLLLSFIEFSFLRKTKSTN